MFSYALALLEHIRKCAVPVAVAVALAAPAPAGAKLLFSTYNEGLEPHVQLAGRSLPIGHPKLLTLEVTGSVRAAVEGRFTVKCYRHGIAKLSREHTVSGVSPADLVVRVGARWDYCRVTRASAGFADPMISGWVEIRAWGTRR